MTRGKVNREALRAARRCLADAEQEALDEVLAIRAEATTLLVAAHQEAEQILATARQEAERILAAPSGEHTAALEAIDAARAQLYDDRGQIVAEREALKIERASLDDERAVLRAERASLDDERTVMDAMREEVHALQASLEAHRQAAPAPPDGSTARTADLLEGTQAEMAELSQLLDQLVDRVADLEPRPAHTDRQP